MDVPVRGTWRAGRFCIAALDDYGRAVGAHPAWRRLEASAQVRSFESHFSGEEELVDSLKGYHGVVLTRERTPMTASIIEQLPRLELILTQGTRLDNTVIDIDAASRRSVLVCGTDSRAGTPSTVELAWGLIFAVLRRIPAADLALRRGSWNPHPGRGLGGKTIGTVGLGKSGSRMVPIAKAFGMRVLAWSTQLREKEAEMLGATAVSRDTLFGESDVVSIHVRLSARSRGYVNAEDLRRMKPTSILINTSRGPIVDEVALVDALREHRIAGAGLDVFSIEPLPEEHPFRHLPTTVLTPHVGYATDEFFDAHVPELVEDVHAFCVGRPIRVLNPSRSRGAADGRVGE